MASAPRIFITVGTDGYRDYVRLPDGREFSLGSVSVLKLVTSLAKDASSARKTLDKFLERKEAMLSVVQQQLEKLLTPKRARWATGLATNALIPKEDRTYLGTGLSIGFEEKMTTRMASDAELKEAVAEMISNIEQHISMLQAQAKASESGSISESVSKSSIEALKEQIALLKKPSAYKGDLSDNSMYYRLASLNVLNKNAAVVETMMEKLAAANDGVDRLVAAGRKFNSSKAKADLHEVTSKLSNLLENADLGQPWVRSELEGLVKQADQLHEYFGNVRV